jgi:general secretion pathway protein G
MPIWPTLLSTFTTSSGAGREEKSRHRFDKRGFTLLELLVVIALLGLLASMVSANTLQAREAARVARTQQDLQQIANAIEISRNRNDAVLADITEYWCSDCDCRNQGDLSALPDDHPCILQMEYTFSKIGLPLLRDPWGSPYLIDENEFEYIWCLFNDPPCDNSAWEQCRVDTVNSAGPDRTYVPVNDPETLLTADNNGIGRPIFPFFCPPYQLGTQYNGCNIDRPWALAC